MPSTNALAIFLAALLAAGWSQDSASAEICPMRIGQPLKFVDVFDGPPEELATLVPDKAKRTWGYWQLGYVYDAGRSVTIRCKYADGNAEDVTLGERVQRCDYTLNQRKDLRLHCK